MPFFAVFKLSQTTNKKKILRRGQILSLPSHLASLGSLADGLRHCSICFIEKALSISLGVHCHQILSPVAACKISTKQVSSVR